MWLRSATDTSRLTFDACIADCITDDLAKRACAVVCVCVCGRVCACVCGRVMSFGWRWAGRVEIGTMLRPASPPRTKEGLKEGSAEAGVAARCFSCSCSSVSSTQPLRMLGCTRTHIRIQHSTTHTHDTHDTHDTHEGTRHDTRDTHAK
jgi:hypothetical protein